MKTSLDSIKTRLESQCAMPGHWTCEAFFILHQLPAILLLYICSFKILISLSLSLLARHSALAAASIPSSILWRFLSGATTVLLCLISVAGCVHVNKIFLDIFFDSVGSRNDEYRRRVKALGNLLLPEKICERLTKVRLNLASSARDTTPPPQKVESFRVLVPSHTTAAVRRSTSRDDESTITRKSSISEVVAEGLTELALSTLDHFAAIGFCFLTAFLIPAVLASLSLSYLYSPVCATTLPPNNFIDISEMDENHCQISKLFLVSVGMIPFHFAVGCVTVQKLVQNTGISSWDGVWIEPVAHRITSNVKYYAMIMSLIVCVSLVLRESGRGFGFLGTYLIVCTLQCLYYASVWTIMDLVLWAAFTSALWGAEERRVKIASFVFVCGVTVTAAYKFETVAASLMLSFSASSFVYVLLKKRVEIPIIDVSGSTRFVVHRESAIFLTFLAAAVGATLLLGLIQQVLGQRPDDVPNTYHLAPTPAAPLDFNNFGLHWKYKSPIGNMSLGHANFKINGHGTEFNTRRDGYSFCGVEFGGVNLVELSLLATLAYTSPSDMNFLREAFFPEWEILPTNSRDDNCPVVFIDFFSKKLNSSVVAIRGTNFLDARDWTQDLELWMDLLVLEIARAFVPGLSLWPTSVTEQILFLLESLKQSLVSSHHDQKYFLPVATYLQNIANRNVIAVGHSLGGGLATIAGVASKVRSVSFSGPGIVENRIRFGLSRRAIERYSVSVVPGNDFASMVGLNSGMVLHTSCHSGWQHVCHMPMHTVCDLLEKCGHPHLDAHCSFHS